MYTHKKNTLLWLRSNIQLVVSALALVIFIGVATSQIQNIEGVQDIQIYRSIGERFHRAAQGYDEAIHAEYPPIAAMLFAAPILGNWSSFGTGWMTLIVICTLSSWMWVSIFAKQDLLAYGLTLPIVVALMGIELTFGRFDFIVGNLILLSMITHRSKHYAQSTFFLAFASILKIVPVIGFPIMWICTQKEHRRDLLYGAMAGVILCGATPMLIIGFDKTIEMFTYLHEYHAHREIQVESTWSSLGLVMYAIAKQKAIIGAGHGSMNYLGFGHIMMQKIAPVFAILGLMSTYLVGYYSKQRSYTILLLSALLVTLFFAPVLSPQYMLWCVPGLIFYCIQSYSEQGVWNLRLVLTTLCVLLLAFTTTWIFPKHYGDFLAQTHWTLPVVLLIRNILLFVLPVSLLITQAQWNVFRTLVRQFLTTEVEPPASQQAAYHPQPFSRKVGVAISITLLHFLIVTSFSIGSTPQARYASLGNWDGEWYRSIAEDGYHNAAYPPIGQKKEASNVAFFPLYPMTGRIVQSVLQLPIRESLILSAQLTAIVFWLYVLLILDLWNIHGIRRFLSIGIILSFPTAFYILTSYSESLFLTSLLGFYYWCLTQKFQRSRWLIAGIHGAMLSATRITGLPLITIPGIISIAERGVRATLSNWKIYASIIIASLGAIGFFIYCQIAFGHWDIYLTTQAIGWGTHMRIETLLDPKTYTFSMPFILNAADIPRAMNIIVRPLFAILILVTVAIECWTSGLRGVFQSIRTPLYFASMMIFCISVGATDEAITQSHTRYFFPIAVMLVLAAQSMRLEKMPRMMHGLSEIVLPAVIMLQFIMQFTLIMQFTAGKWVA